MCTLIPVNSVTENVRKRPSASFFRRHNVGRIQNNAYGIYVFILFQQSVHLICEVTDSMVAHSLFSVY